MKEVSKFFGLREGDVQVCNGWKFECIKVDKELAKKLDSAPCLFGTLTSPTGEVTEYINKHVFASKLNKIAGVSSSAIIPAKVDNSQTKGENKVISATLSASKQQKRFLKAYKLCRQASEVYGLTDVFSGMLEQLQKLDNYVNNCEAIKTQQAIEAAKAEAEAKAKAEAAAKELQKAVAELQSIVKNFVECGMSYKQAEQFAKNNPKYTDEQKEAAFGK